MSLFSSVLCAVDHSDIAPRVLRQAIGFAGACNARLTILTVDGQGPRQREADLSRLLHEALPGGAPYVVEPRLQVVRLTQGEVADAILEFTRDRVDLLVAGTHGRSGLSRWFLGSTSAALLERATCPTLLVPPGEVDVVALGADRASLDVGVVLAAVDPAEHNHAQLGVAAGLATLAGQPLVLMTVADDHDSTADAEQSLMALGRELRPTPVDHLVVRRGRVPEQIAGAATAERARLIVMGLRSPRQGVPGQLATDVLHAKCAAVIVVPAAWQAPGA